MDQFQLSFAGKQINGGGILEGRNKERVFFFFKESQKSCMYKKHGKLGPMPHVLSFTKS